MFILIKNGKKNIPQDMCELNLSLNIYSKGSLIGISHKKLSSEEKNEMIGRLKKDIQDLENPKKALQTKEYLQKI